MSERRELWRNINTDRLWMVYYLRDIEHIHETGECMLVELASYCTPKHLERHLHVSELARDHDYMMSDEELDQLLPYVKRKK